MIMISQQARQQKVTEQLQELSWLYEGMLYSVLVQIGTRVLHTSLHHFFVSGTCGADCIPT